MSTSTTETTSHEVTLFAEPIFHVGGFTITNSLVTSWLTVLIITVVAVFVRRNVRVLPGRLQSAAELVLEQGLTLADSVTGSRERTKKVFPLVFGVFLFILVNNWLGLLPGIGSIGFIEGGAHGTFVPLLRGATADFNTTLALALTSVIGANLFGVVAVGAWHYFNKFVNVKLLAEMPRKVMREPAIVLVNPIKFFVGLIEVVGEVAKVASLSFRLFGNIFAGEVLLVSVAAIMAYLVPIPFMFLEVIVGIIQALIFAMLTLVYFSVAATAEEH